MIEVSGLGKSFKKHLILDDINFRVKRGDFLGIVGPNGSGKSTLLRILVGILSPSRGYVKILGKEPYKDKSILKKMGVVFGNKSGLWPYVPVKDNLKYIAKLYGVKPDLDLLAKEFDARELMNALPKSLSLGQRMKCELMEAMVHNPDIVILDEPTIGLDISVRRNFLQYLQYLKKKGKTIVLVSHAIGDMDDVDKLILIGNKRIAFEGTPRELKSKIKYKIIMLQLSKPFGGKYVVRTRLKEGSSIDDALHLFSSKGVVNFEVHTPSVEDILEDLYLRVK